MGYGMKKGKGGSSKYGGKGTMGNAGKVMSIKGNAQQGDVGKLKMVKPHNQGYDPKAYDYNY